MTGCPNSAHRWYTRFGVYSIDECCAFRKLRLLIDGALYAGDLVLASGDKCFWHEFRDILGEDRAFFFDGTRADDGSARAFALMYDALDAARDCENPPAAIIYLDKSSRSYERFLEATAIFDAINPRIARVVGLSNFDDSSRQLRIVGRKVICEAL